MSTKTHKQRNAGLYFALDKLRDASDLIVEAMDAWDGHYAEPHHADARSYRIAAKRHERKARTAIDRATKKLRVLSE